MFWTILIRIHTRINNRKFHSSNNYFFSCILLMKFVAFSWFFDEIGCFFTIFSWYWLFFYNIFTKFVILLGLFDEIGCFSRFFDEIYVFCTFFFFQNSHFFSGDSLKKSMFFLLLFDKICVFPKIFQKLWSYLMSKFSTKCNDIINTGESIEKPRNSRYTGTQSPLKK